MAKFYGSMVKTGKVGGSVFTVAKGVTIEKQYQPIVSNPSTVGQVEQRTKFKLVSQLAAALQEELAYVGSGLVSARNMFVKDIFRRDAVTYADGVATVLPSGIRLTSSRIAPFLSFNVSRSGNVVTVSLAVSNEYRSKVMGVRLVGVKARGVGIAPDVLPIGTTVVPDATTGTAQTTFPVTVDEGIAVYGYAFWPQSESAITKYGEMLATIGDVQVSLERVRRVVPLGMEYSATYYGFSNPD